MKRCGWMLVLAAVTWWAAAGRAPVSAHGAHGERAPQSGAAADPKDWIQLFNGRNLDGWTPKIKGYPLGENYADTFRVTNGLLQASYDKYTRFDDRFGHLFYERKFSYYIIAAEYRFVGEQVPGGPDWAIRNNGLMLHSQAPQTMGKDQDFPISIEAQLLGGGPSGNRTTANVCTPGTEIFMNGTMVKGHCFNSKSETYRGDRWVRVEIEVRGGEKITHKVEGQTVLEYEKPTIGGGAVSGFDPTVKKDGTLLTEGYITIQGESHPTDFRKIELLNLSGCMDAKSPKYKPYFVHPEEGACK
jgi:3-keto-disaccharide hydrolase